MTSNIEKSGPHAQMLTLDNVATGETYMFLQRARDTNGDVLRLRWSAQPGGQVGEHIHPAQEERFTVIAGELTVSIEGKVTVCTAGETVAVPAGVRHSFANRGTVPVEATLEIRPALRMEQVFESLAGYSRDGKAGAGGLPRNPLLLGVFAHEYAGEIRGPKPPYPVQRLLLPLLAAIGRRFGYRAHKPEYAVEVAGAA
jgi:quercetin dioxygenase-like cupin family protein